MKAFYIPAASLLLILLVSLLTGYYVQQSSAKWISELEAVVTLIDEGSWGEAEQCISETMQDWLRHETVYHMLLEHQDLDEAEELFFGTLAACRARDPSEVHIHLQLLISQLQFLAETQKAGIKNFL